MRAGVMIFCNLLDFICKKQKNDARIFARFSQKCMGVKFSKKSLKNLPYFRFVLRHVSFLNFVPHRSYDYLRKTIYGCGSSNSSPVSAEISDYYATFQKIK